MFFAELNEMLVRELAEDGYSGVEVRVTPLRTEIIIRATRTANVLGEKGRRIRELTSLVQRRFGFAEGTVELYAEKVNNRGLCAIAQCESLRYKLLGGLAVRRYVYHDSLTTTTDTNAESSFACSRIVSAPSLDSIRERRVAMVHAGAPIQWRF